MTSCNRTDCSKPGRWAPKLLLFPDDNPAAAPFVFLLGVVECDDHKAAGVVSDYIAEDGYEQVDKVFRILRGASIDRSRTAVVHERAEVARALFGRARKQ